MKVDFPRLIRAFTGQPEPVPPPVIIYEPLTDFATLADLQAWFELHDELRMEAPNLCDDYSRESIELAQADGHRLSTCLVADGIAYFTRVQPAGTAHIANSAIVTDIEECWYVDLAFNQLLKLTNFYKGGKF